MIIFKTAFYNIHFIYGISLHLNMLKQCFVMWKLGSSPFTQSFRITIINGHNYVCTIIESADSQKICRDVDYFFTYVVYYYCITVGYLYNEVSHAFLPVGGITDTRTFERLIHVCHWCRRMNFIRSLKK